MADENENNNTEKETPNYVRKNNLIKGVDNDHLLIFGILGLGALIAAPHVKNMIDSAMKNLPGAQQQQQQPPNGQANQTVYLPPTVPLMPPKQDEHQLLRDYEKRQEEQKKYQQLQEAERLGESTSISMVPDINASREERRKNRGFEAGSMVSGLSA